MQDLRLGFGLQVAQLLAQARDGCPELAQMKLDRVQLLLEARLKDADLAGAVEKRIEERGIDARRFGALAPSAELGPPQARPELPRRRAQAPRPLRLRLRRAPLSSVGQPRAAVAGVL